MDVVSLKIGGSVLTYKNEEDWKKFPLEISEIKKKALEFISIENIEKIVKKEISPVLGKINLNIIAIGVGPFGHDLVHKNILPEVIHESVSYYCTVIEELFKEHGLPVEYDEKYSPRHTVSYANIYDMKKISEWVVNLQNKGKIALTHGDMSMDDKVVSGDQIIPYTAIELKSNRIVGASDVDGLYTKDPKKYPDAEFIPLVTADEKLDILYEKKGTDVTGRMLKKVERFQEAAKYGIKGYIVNGLKRGYLKNALLGKETICTLIIP